MGYSGSQQFRETLKFLTPVFILFSAGEGGGSPLMYFLQIYPPGIEWDLTWDFQKVVVYCSDTSLCFQQPSG